MLSYLYCFVVKGKLISAKILPPVGIEPATLRPKCFQSHAYPIISINKLQRNLEKVDYNIDNLVFRREFYIVRSGNIV